MFKNYITIAIRNLIKNKLFSVINIGGLAIGLTATILILLFVNEETSYDAWVPDHERIYRLHSTFDIPGRDAFRTTRSSGPMHQGFQDNFPEIEAATRLFYSQPRVFKDGAVHDQSVTLVDPGFFKVFDIPLTQGNRDTALNNTNSLVVSETTAARYFGEENPIGKVLTLCCYGENNESIDYVITGVMADTPENSHFVFNAIGLIEEARFSNQGFLFESWTSVNNFNYFKLREGAKPEQISDRFDWFEDNIIPGNDQTFEQFGINQSELITLTFMPMADIHLNAKFQAGDGGDIRPLGDKTLVIGFLLIAFLILGIATINFINLATARFIQRSREVSLRKVMGAGRRQIAQQFLGEAVIASLLALVLAIGLVEISLPWYNNFLGLDLSLVLFGEGSVLFELLLISLLAGLFGGSYPALSISNIRPAKVLKANQSTESKGSARLKNVLVVFQFSIAIALITATAVTYSQTDFAKSVDLGYESDNRLVIRSLGRSGAQEMQTTLQTRLKALPGVINVARSSDVPTDNNENNTGFTILGKEQEAGNQILNYIVPDYGFFEIYKIEPIFGRTFSEEYGNDQMFRPDPDSGAAGAAVINVSAAKRLGFDNPEDAVGEVLSTQLFRNGGLMTVIGIVPDVSFRSAHFEGLPTVYFSFEAMFDDMTVHFQGREPQVLVSEVEKIWGELIPSVPFNAVILGDLISSQYADEERQVKTFTGFALLAIVISSMGLFALAAFSTERRTKEIGIRKVFGASIRNLVQMLAWQFSKPVVIANILALPVAWYFLNDWLNGFVYRIPLSPTYFVAAGLLALLVAWGTVAGHAWKVARSNPIKALRYE